MSRGVQHIIFPPVPPVTGPAVPFSAGTMSISAVSLPDIHGLPSAQGGLFSWKRTPHASTKDARKRRENLIHFNSCGLSPLNVKIFSSPKNEAVSAF